MNAEENESSRVYLERFRTASRSIQEVRLKLNAVRRSMENCIMGCKISRGIGTGVSTVGYAAFLGSVFVFPPLALVGISLTAVGGTIGVGTAITDTLLTNSGIKEISESVDRFKSHYKSVLLLCERFAQTVFHNSARLQKDFSLMRDLMNDQNNQLESKWIDLKSITADRWIEGIKIAGKSAPHLMLFTCATYAKPEVFNAVIASLKLVNKFLKIFGPAASGIKLLMKTVVKIMEGCSRESVLRISRFGASTVETGVTAGNVAKSSARAIAPAVAVSVLGGILVAVDISFTIFQNHFQKHVTIEQINGVLPFIEAIGNEMNQILRELENFLAAAA